MEANRIYLKKTVFLILLFCFIGNVIGQESHLRLLDKFFRNRNQHTSLSYDVEYKMKTFAMEDTLSYSARVELVKNEADTIFGGNLVLDLNSLWLGYNGEDVIKAFVDSSRLILADPHRYPGIYIQSTFYNDLIDYGFLKSNTGMLQYFQDTIYQVTVKDSILNGRPCLVLMILLPDHDIIYNQSIFVALDTNELFIVNRKYSAYFQGNEQYSEWTFSNLEYHDNPIIHKLEKENILKFNRIENYEFDTLRYASMRKFDYANLSGKILNQDKYIRLDEVKSPFILLDFWYSACFPCIKSIPMVNDLYKNYVDKGMVVYGVNLIDDEIAKKSRLEKFIKSNPMYYQSIMVDDALNEQIYVEGYPMIIVLDNNYKVIYKEVGYNENLYNEIAAILEAKK